MDPKVKFAEVRADMYRRLGTHVITKAKYRRFWKMLDILLRIVSFGKMTTFMQCTTTIGRLVAFPEGTDLYHATKRDLLVLMHERRHVLQFDKYGLLLMSLLYLFVPLPIGLAYFRYKFEMEAYRDEYRYAQANGWDVDPDWFLQNLCGAPYLWAWPKRWVKLPEWLD
jgi:hypothetical protein